MRKSKAAQVATRAKKNAAGRKVTDDKSPEKVAQPAALNKAKGSKEHHYNSHNTRRNESLDGLPLASFKQRFIAYAIDGLIVVSVTGLILTYIHYLIFDVWHIKGTLFHIVQGQATFEGKLEMEKTEHFIEVITVLIYFGLSVWLTNGLTLGKRLIRIRVVSLTHERITLWQSVERALGYGASALEAGFGFIQFFIYPNRTCVHDRIAETIVVKEPRVKKEKGDTKK